MRREGTVMESTPQLLWHADQERRMWDRVLPKTWYTPEDLDKDRVYPIHVTR